MIGNTNRNSGRNFRAAGGVACLALGVVLGLAVQGTAQKSRPMKEAEILDLLQGDVSSARIASLVGEMGIDFVMTTQIEQKFRRAGAQQVLIDALRKASRQPVTEAPPSTGTLNVETKPGEAEVYLDDEPKGTSSLGGKLRLTGLQAKTYNLRVSLAGYRSWENPITVTAGETQTVFVTLVEKPPEKPAITISPTPSSPKPLANSTPVPIPGARVESMRFFESGLGTTPPPQRRYSNRFPKAATRYINWEVDLEYPKVASRVDFTIIAVWTGLDGREVHRQTMGAYALPGWTSGQSAYGYGCKATPCSAWNYGTYTVTLYVAGKQLASSSFEIY